MECAFRTLLSDDSYSIHGSMYMSPEVRPPQLVDATALVWLSYGRGFAYAYAF